MKKEIKDYLHLYLGCQFILQIKDSPSFSAPMYFGTEALSAALTDNRNKINPILLLRPLSDMTEDEGFELSEYLNTFTPHHFMNAIKEGSKYVIDYRCSFELTQYLLSKHFDIFNLIPEGLAIDSTIKIKLK